MAEIKPSELELLKEEHESLKQKLKKSSEENANIREAALKVLERDRDKTVEITRLMEESRQKSSVIFMSVKFVGLLEIIFIIGLLKRLSAVRSYSGTLIRFN